MMDEPSLGLAHALRRHDLDIIGSNEAGVTVLLSQQNAKLLSVADTGYVMETGAITFGQRPGPLADDRVRKGLPRRSVKLREREPRRNRRGCSWPPSLQSFCSLIRRVAELHPLPQTGGRPCWRATGVQLRQRHRPAEGNPPAGVAADVAQHLGLLGFLDPFGDDLQAQAVPELDDGLDDAQAAVGERRAWLNEGLVDLESVNVEFLR